MIKYDFTGKVVLVTGSSRGMGASILENFARAGAVCFVNYFDDPDGQNRKDAEATAGKLKELNATAHVVAADVRNFDSVGVMMNQVKEKAGGLDILVNNAGICRDKTLKKISLDEWHSVIDTNLTGVFYCMKQGIEILRDHGRIINMSSVAAYAGIHGQSNYAAAKAGVIAMTKVVARELAKRRITVNAIAPGIIETPMLGDIKAEVVAGYEKMIPIGRIGSPDDVANAALFLASEDSEYITGQTLPVTGGWY